eukprot:5866674-Pleurochrysis_carterae.AAC.1
MLERERATVAAARGVRSSSQLPANFSMYNAWVYRGEVISAPMKTAIVHTRKPHGACRKQAKA